MILMLSLERFRSQLFGIHSSFHWVFVNVFGCKMNVFLLWFYLQVDATQRTVIEELPPVLVLHLKWFHYDKNGGLQKRIKQVDFDIDLELSKGRSIITAFTFSFAVLWTLLILIAACKIELFIEYSLYWNTLRYLQWSILCFFWYLAIVIYFTWKFLYLSIVYIFLL